MLFNLGKPSYKVAFAVPQLCIAWCRWPQKVQK